MNIVFDLGGVVFRWQQDLVRAEIFEHSDWIELDRGSITLGQAIVRGTSRTGLPRGDIEKLFKAVPQSLTPIDETIELIREIRGSNNSFFVLSNMHAASISYLEKTYKIWSLFDGIVISSRIQMVKPEIEIYRHLLATYALNAAETVFIDDMSENLAAASKVGINTIKFLDADQCRQALMNLGCF